MDRRDFLIGSPLMLGAACSGCTPTPPLLDLDHTQSVSADADAFPKNFLWGTSTAAHTHEGGNTNSDYWFLENLEDSPFTEKSLDTCDHYHRYVEDIKLMADLGLNAYRFSIEWARIEPVPGIYSNAALDHYQRLLQACRDAGIAPVVTYHHFTSPIWLAKLGGWEQAETADRFAEYAQVVTRRLGNLITAVCTINELNFSALLNADNFIPRSARKAFLKRAARAAGSKQFSCPPFGDADKSSETMLAAHKKAFQEIKSVAPTLPTGLTISMNDTQAVEGGEEKRDAFRRYAEDPFLEAARGNDFVGVQGYTRKQFGPNGQLDLDPDAKLTQMDYEFWPDASAATMRRAHDVIPDVPIIITESGVAADNDADRITFIQQSLEGLLANIQNGIPLFGYFHFSLVDNFEWTNGYAPNFGLYALDRQTFARTERPSAQYLGAIAQNNKLS